MTVLGLLLSTKDKFNNETEDNKSVLYGSESRSVTLESRDGEHC